MEKIAELKRAKLLALSLLLIAAAAFITTLFLPQTFWVRGVKAIAEAAMVGALADWFAVVALFRRVPIPFISRHTAIIPRNKDRIGDNLGQFVQEKFLDTQSLVALIRRYEPAKMIGTWFSQPDNAQRVRQHLIQVMSGFWNSPTTGAFSDCSNGRCIRPSIRSISPKPAPSCWRA